MSPPSSAGTIPTFSRPILMSDERQYVTLFEFVRWLLPSAVVVLGVVLYFLYPELAAAVGAVGVTP